MKAPRPAARKSLCCQLDHSTRYIARADVALVLRSTEAETPGYGLAAGASVEKIGEAAACAVKRLHLDHRMVQAATRVGVTLKEGFEVHGDRVAFDAKTGLWTVTSAEVCRFRRKTVWAAFTLAAHETLQTAQCI